MDNILDHIDEPKQISLADLVGEGKKYANADELAKAYHNADTHIRTLTTAQDQLREDYLKAREENQTRAKFEDLLKRLEGVNLPDQSTSVAADPKPFDMTQLDNILGEKINQGISSYEAQRRERNNQEQVVKELKERFGDNFGTSVKQQIGDMGLSEKDFNDLARRSPQTVLKLFERPPQESFQAPMRNSSNYTPKTQPERTWSYYQNLKKADPKAYHNPKIQNEMTESAVRLGDKFYDGDYNRFGDLSEFR